jgi:hypothetical protein
LVQQKRSELVFGTRSVAFSPGTLTILTQVIRDFLKTSRRNSPLRHDRLLPDPFQFINRPIISRHVVAMCYCPRQRSLNKILL